LSKVIRSIKIDEGVFPLVFQVEELDKQHKKKDTYEDDDVNEIVLAGARKEAERLIRHAEEEAKRIIGKAKEQEEKILKEAEKRGYKKGYEEGIKAAGAEADRIRQKAFEALAEAEKKREEIIRSSEEEVVELCMAIAAKVVHAHVDVHRETVIKLAREALERLAAAKYYTILVNPDDVELVEQYVDELRRSVSSNSHIHILGDAGISYGGCKVETENGIINATLESQLDEIRKVLSEEKLK